MNLRWKTAQAAEIRWWRAYLRKKDKSEYLAWKKDYWRGFLQNCGLAVPMGARCLDAGCGPAGVFTVLEQQQVVAIDPLLGRYEAELEHFQPADYPHVQFIESPLEQLPTAEPFDVVFCLNVINHVADIRACWERLWAATRAGGVLVVSVDAHNRAFFKHLFRLIPADILHPHQYDLAEYIQMAEGFSPQRVEVKPLKREFFFSYYALVVYK